MSSLFQYIFPLAVAVGTLGLFHVVASLHVRLSESETIEPERLDDWF